MKIERVNIVDPGDPLDADHAFVHRVRQPWRADEIANRVDAGLAGAQPFVDGDMAPFDGDTGVFKPDVFDIADNPDGKDDAVGYGAGRKVKGGKPGSWFARHGSKIGPPSARPLLASWGRVVYGPQVSYRFTLSIHHASRLNRGDGECSGIGRRESHGQPGEQ